MSTSLLKVISERVDLGIFYNLIIFIALETKQKWDKIYFQKEENQKIKTTLYFQSTVCYIIKWQWSLPEVLSYLKWQSREVVHPTWSYMMTWRQKIWRLILFSLVLILSKMFLFYIFHVTKWEINISCLLLILFLQKQLSLLCWVAGRALTDTL